MTRRSRIRLFTSSFLSCLFIFAACTSPAPKNQVENKDTNTKSSSSTSTNSGTSSATSTATKSNTDTSTTTTKTTTGTSTTTSTTTTKTTTGTSTTSSTSTTADAGVDPEEKKDAAPVQPDTSRLPNRDATVIVTPRDTAPAKTDTQRPTDTSRVDAASTCTPACSSTQSCVNNACVNLVSTGSDGCGDTLASNLTLQQIAVYQTVKIPIMESMSAVATRNADVVQGRTTLFRVFVTVGTGWTARELSARLTLTPTDGAPAVFYSKKSISASSTDAVVANTFQIVVPPESITAGLKYSVEVVECTSQSGTAGKARFPESGDSDLSPRATGGLKIKVIPLKFNDLVPDTSDTALEGYAKHFMAMYPVNNVEITVGDTLTAASPLNWTNMLDQVRTKRVQDAPAADVYYFGLVKPAATFREYCASSCTLGVGYVATSATTSSSRAAVGAGFADRTSWDTMAHEVGHNHGRNHAPCATGGSISGVDSAYPYTNAQLGTWGYDSRTQSLIDPTKGTDLMAYCSNKWLSDYNYKALTTRVATVNKASHAPASQSATGPYRVLLIDESGQRWGSPTPKDAVAEGDPETATIYDQTGAPLTTVTVYRTLIGDLDASMVQIPEPQPNWYAVEVAGGAPYPFAAQAAPHVH